VVADFVSVKRRKRRSVGQASGSTSGVSCSGLKAGQNAVSTVEFPMSCTKRTSKRKRRSKAAPVLGAAGLSLALASEASLATPAASLDTMTHTARGHHEIVLYEEEIFDFSLATFRVFDKEKLGSVSGRQATQCFWRRCLLPVRVFGRAEPFWF
jgi:hypothetical protein